MTEIPIDGGSGELPLGTSFLAQRISTSYEWSDLVLDEQSKAEIEDIAS